MVVYPTLGARKTLVRLVVSACREGRLLIMQWYLAGMSYRKSDCDFYSMKRNLIAELYPVSK